MRLIDADTVKENMDITLKILKIIFHEKGQREHLISAFHTVSLIVDDSETIDAVPVIRCKDCKYHREFLCDRLKYSYVTNADSFCSEGERKDDGMDS